ncbi:hypothetical protein [Amycolatopsis jiangsuensis]|uniref:Uncharacterized protein n=1 Tax=Amycolatopsis jiangsuensis TaxID=1181879 RepID=A0A840J601_9PSEU|nr:hypothetical protein [Amycolatopsis jiangsuensis]MBB4688834.1 hypothetical protein [Amycolatopsis jiangsuensis]
MPDSAFRPRMPGRLRAALAFVFVQALFNGFFGVLMQVEVSDRQDHGQDVDGVLYFAEFVSYFFAVALVASAVIILLGYDWGRWPLLVLEGLAALNGVITLVSGGFTALVGLLLAALVISTLFHDTVRSWFDAKAYQRRGGSAA